jgi:hypothetical protein
MTWEVCSEENIPVDIQKITPIQIITGSQYLTKYLMIISRFLMIQVYENGYCVSRNNDHLRRFAVSGLGRMMFITSDAYKSPVQIAGPDHLLQIQTRKAELFIFPFTINAHAFLKKSIRYF